MNKQQFLAMNIPHDLKVADFNDEGKLLKIHILYGGNYYSFCKFNYYKPILRPLSDLTKEIEHKGEKFVPMIELAKMIIDLPDYNPFCFNSKTSAILQSEKNEFGYNHKGKSFHLFDREIVEFKPFPNQLELFQKLFEWHFDIADLISKGEAIDVNTLETNPYK